MSPIIRKFPAVLAVLALTAGSAACSRADGSMQDTTGRNAAVVAGTACRKAGTFTKVSGQRVVCGATPAGKTWFAVAKVRTTACRTLGAVRKTDGVAFVCGRTKSARVWIATRPLPGVGAAAPATPQQAQLQLQSTDAGANTSSAPDPGVVAGAPAESVPPIGATTTTVPRAAGPYAADLKVRSIVTSTTSACALLLNGAVQCWGLNTSGDLGNPRVSETTVPVTNALFDGQTAQAVAIAAAPYGTFCAVATTGAVWCWGYGSEAELGDGSRKSSAAPVTVRGFPAGTQVVKVFGGLNMFCAVDSTQHLWCWGAHSYSGRIPTAGGQEYVSAATQVLGMENVAVASVVITWSSVCALTTVGTVWCWGSNFNNTMGTAKNAGLSTVMPPTLVAGIGQAPFVGQQITGNFLSVCVMSTTGAVKCWGTASQLGAGTTEDSPVPVGVAPADGSVLKAKSIFSGTWSNCLITIDGALWCWGSPNLQNWTWETVLLTPTLMSGYDGVTRKAVAYASTATSMFVVTSGGVLNIESDGVYGLRGDGYAVVEDVVPN